MHIDHYKYALGQHFGACCECGGGKRLSRACYRPTKTNFSGSTKWKNTAPHNRQRKLSPVGLISYNNLADVRTV